jgi:lipopolysaccharide export system protein LptC
VKNIIQFSLVFIIGISLYFFYNTYLAKDVTSSIETLPADNEFLPKNTNNQIKNLRYEVNLDNNNQYIITSNFSELINSNEYEIVKMQGVEAIFIEKEKIPILIKSDNADYNNENYNTEFKNNVLIEYMDNKIFSDKLNIDFKKNKIRIFENVLYEGEHGKMKTDNIVINLTTKEIDISMQNENKNVELIKY